MSPAIAALGHYKMRSVSIMTGFGAACVVSVLCSRATLGLHHRSSDNFVIDHRISTQRLIGGGELPDTPPSETPGLLTLATFADIITRVPGALGDDQGLPPPAPPRSIPGDDWGHGLDLAPTGGVQSTSATAAVSPPTSPPAADDDASPATFAATAADVGGLQPQFGPSDPGGPPAAPPAAPSPIDPVAPPPPSPPDLPIVATGPPTTILGPPPALFSPPPSGSAGAAPEPSTWATMLLGASAVALALRRRRRGAGTQERTGHAGRD